MSRYKTSRGGTLIGIFIGLVCGVVLAAAVVWYVNKMPLPFIPDKTQQQTVVIPSDGVPVSLPGKPGDSPSAANAGDVVSVDATEDKLRFEFYKKLEDTETAATATTPPATPPTAATTPATASSSPPAVPPVAGTPSAPAGESIILQVGSFLDASEADNQRARLALIGINAQVYQAMLQDKVWYRVRLGPLHSQEEADKKRAELTRNGFEAVVVK